MIVFFFANDGYVDACEFGEYQLAEKWLRGATVNDWPAVAVHKTADGWKELSIRYEDGKLILGE